jgi:hypothetical protein
MHFSEPGILLKVEETGLYSTVYDIFFEIERFPKSKVDKLLEGEDNLYVSPT